MSEIPAWSVEPYGRGHAICRKFDFPSFEEAIRFMSTAANRISELDHHPDWQNVWRFLTVRLTTHDAGDQPTELDYSLAKYLDELYLAFMLR